MSFLGFDSLGALTGGVLDKFVDLGINMIGTKYANDLNMKNWYKQMDYNAPINQLARLREAGLNPNLIYGSGGVQNTISSAPKMDAPNSKSLDLFAYQQLLNGKKQGELLDEQIKKTKTDTNNAMLKSMSLTLDNVFKDLENDYKSYENDYYISHGTVRGQNMVGSLIDKISSLATEYPGFNPWYWLFDIAGSIKGHEGYKYPVPKGKNGVGFIYRPYVRRAMDFGLYDTY